MNLVFLNNNKSDKVSMRAQGEALRVGIMMADNIQYNGPASQFLAYFEDIDYSEQIDFTAGSRVEDVVIRAELVKISTSF